MIDKHDFLDCGSFENGLTSWPILFRCVKSVLETAAIQKTSPLCLSALVVKTLRGFIYHALGTSSMTRTVSRAIKSSSLVGKA
jgi:hypothetical protein